MMICIGQQYAYGFKSSHRSKCFIEVNPFNLSVSLSNETESALYRLEGGE